VLDYGELQEINESMPLDAAVGSRYSEAMMQMINR